jgi:hypothetical protein
MLITESVDIELGGPQSGGSEPSCIASIDGFELSNNLRDVDWDANPVHFHICGCGSSRCSISGLAHVSEFGGDMLLSYPQNPPNDLGWGLPDAIARRGPAIITQQAWEQLKASVPELPDIGELPQANGRAMLEAWLADVGRAFDTQEEADTIRLIADQLLCAQTLDIDEAKKYLENLSSWLLSNQELGISGRAIDVVDSDYTMEKLYIDASPVYEWAAFCIRGVEVYPVFGGKKVLVLQG